MKPILTLLPLIAALLALPEMASAQFPGANRQQQQQGQQQGLDQLDVLLDTFDVFYFYADNPNLEIPFSDTTLDDFFRQYDPTRRRRLDYRQLGILGSAHEPIVFEVPERRGFDIGQHQYDLYMTNGDQLKYYRLEKPVSIFAHTIGSEQADSYTKADFSRNFANGLNYTLDYDRITQFGENTQYPNQNVRNTTFNNGLWFQHPNNRYEAFFSVAANTIQMEDNGGVWEEPALGGEFSSPSAAEVLLGDARTRHAHREVSYTHYYRFGGGQDSIKGTRRAYTIAHKARFQNSLYKYADAYNPAVDSFYNRFPAFLIDPRGARFYLRHRQYENEFKLATFKLRGEGRDEAVQQRDLLEVGAVHTLHQLVQTNGDSTLNNLFLTGRYRLNPSERLLIDLRGHLGLLANAGDYRVSGDLFFDFKKLGQLELRGVSQLYSPTLMQHRMYLSERQLYRNNFDKTLSTTLQGKYILPGVQFSAEARYHLLNNFIYFGTDGLPQQTGVPISIGQLIVEKNFNLFWNLHFDNLFALQQSSQEVLRLPTFFGKHSFYYAGKWFRVLDVKLGVDLRYNEAFRANYYNPITGQFQLQDEQTIPFYPAADAFFLMKVTRFRAFFKWENGTAAFLDDYFYQTALYPYHRAVFRIGINWRFLD
ncbi:putative porin [Phaeodactylibacter xiamenensis]|jgi:hypothetical protein|uniref:putative porin n=1 Tax=Phaeodactylibacter xiamenensis TaxID=1524460 RepID=UPI003BAA7A41